MSRIPMRSFPVYTFAFAVALGCAPRDQQAGEEAAAPAGPNVVEIVATEYAFQMPDTVPAGANTFRLVGRGVEPHHAQVVRLDSGKTMADAQAAAAGGGPPPAWVVFVGGPNPPPPSGASETTIDLQPGNYVVLCFIPAPDGMPHVAKGMMKGLTVVSSSEPRSMPTADVTMRLKDYAFDTSPALTAGRHMIRVTTEAGQQPHEVTLVKLADGKTAQDFMTAMAAMDQGKAQGPPPGTFMGGVAALAPGIDNYFAVDLTPGEYVLICFVPDSKDGKPHFVHGMVQQITVM